MQPPTIGSNLIATYGPCTRRPLFAWILTWVILTWLVLSCSHVVLAGVVLDGDFDVNGVLDSDDANLLTAEIAAGTDFLLFDMNFDGFVNLVDLDLWFPLYSTDSGVPLVTALVDVDFSTVNEVTDFQIIQSNLSVATTNFTDGNLNADSVVDVADWILYINRGGVVVPEPSTLTLTACGLLGLLTRRKRRA